MSRNLLTEEGRAEYTAAFRSPDTRQWMCSDCDTLWPAELCRCLQCGSNRGYTPYALYARTYGDDGMVRDPGTAYFDLVDDELEERRLRPLDDRATEIPDDEPPIVSWPEVDSGPAEDEEVANLGSEAPTSASSAGIVEIGHFVL